MSGIRLVTLDVTNTLLKISQSPGHQYASVAKIYGIDVKASDINSCFKYKYRHYSEKYPNFGTKVGMTPYKWWTDLVKDAFRSVADVNTHCQVLPSTNQSEILTQIANHLYLHFSTAKAWEIQPGAVELLHGLQTRGFKVGAISNFDSRLEKILTNLSLRHYFDFVVTSVHAGYEKPHGQIFQHALSLCSIPASQAVHVGDSYRKDYLGAKDVGMSAILLAADKNKVEASVDPQHVIGGLYEVIDRLDVSAVDTAV